MPDRANDPLPEAPDLSETAQAIARGRELVKQAQRLGEEADRQIEGVQATIEQADRVLDQGVLRPFEAVEQRSEIGGRGVHPTLLEQAP